MLTLSTKAREPVDVHLDGGAVVTVRPADVVIEESASAEADRILDRIRDGVAAMDAAGVAHEFDPADDKMMAGLRAHLFAVELLVECITGWSGIGDEDGNPVDPDRTTVIALAADARVARRLLAAALRSVHGVRMEGNGSAVSPRGAGAAAEATAPDAATSKLDAPAAGSA